MNYEKNYGSFLQKNEIIKLLESANFEKLKVPYNNNYYYTQFDFNIYFVNNDVIIEYQEKIFRVFNLIKIDIILGIINFNKLDIEIRNQESAKFTANNFIAKIRNYK